MLIRHWVVSWDVNYQYRIKNGIRGVYYDPFLAHAGADRYQLQFVSPQAGYAAAAAAGYTAAAARAYTAAAAAAQPVASYATVAGQFALSRTRFNYEQEIN
uniref:Uncharacterized protein n=1 Tax=Strigamia maritima TaxID=126957 RepID=T1JAH1_STRMM